MPSDSDVGSGTRSGQQAEAGPVARAAALRPLLREQAGRGERDRVVPAQIVDALGEAAAAKPLSFTTDARQADSVGVQTQVAEAALKLETARPHTYQAVDAVDRAAPVGPLDYTARAHIRAQAGYAAQQVLDSIGILLNVHGSSAFAETYPLQRIWRDAHVAARHAGLIPAVGLEVYGKSLLGVDERVSLMVRVRQRPEAHGRPPSGREPDRRLRRMAAWLPPRDDAPARPTGGPHSRNGSSPHSVNSCATASPTPN